MSRAGAAERGFTLVEILVVLLLLGLLTALAAPRFASFGQPSLRDVGRNVVAELRSRRSEAMRTGKPVVVAASGLHVPAGFALTSMAADGTAPAPAGPIFLPDGRSTGGILLLAGPSDQAHIVVDWLTGEVRLLP